MIKGIHQFLQVGWHGNQFYTSTPTVNEGGFIFRSLNQGFVRFLQGHFHFGRIQQFRVHLLLLAQHHALVLLQIVEHHLHIFSHSPLVFIIIIQIVAYKDKLRECVRSWQTTENGIGLLHIVIGKSFCLKPVQREPALHQQKSKPVLMSSPDLGYRTLRHVRMQLPISIQQGIFLVVFSSDAMQELLVGNGSVHVIYIRMCQQKAIHITLIIIYVLMCLCMFSQE